MRESPVVALYRAMRLGFGYGFESCDANGPRNVKNTNLAKHRPLFSSTAKFRIWTLRIWGFRGPGFRSARQGPCGTRHAFFSHHFSKHLGSVLGRTELCHEVRNPGPPKSPNHPQRKPPFGTVRFFFPHFFVLVVRNWS